MASISSCCLSPSVTDCWSARPRHDDAENTVRFHRNCRSGRRAEGSGEDPDAVTWRHTAAASPSALGEPRPAGLTALPSLAVHEAP